MGINIFKKIREFKCVILRIFTRGGGGARSNDLRSYSSKKSPSLHFTRQPTFVFFKYNSWCNVNVYYDFIIFVYILEANISDSSSEFQYWLDYGSHKTLWVSLSLGQCLSHCISIELFELAYQWDKSFSMCNNIINYYIFIKFIMFKSNQFTTASFVTK